MNRTATVSELDFAERVRRKVEFDGQLRFGAGAFNRKTDRLNHDEYRRQHDEKWMDPATGLVARGHALERACPVCDGRDSRTLFVKAGFPHLQCRRCTMIYVSPCLSPESQAADVEEESSYSTVLANPLSLQLDELKFAYGMDVLSQFMPSEASRSICDIGCGPGVFLSIAKARGFDVFAVEPGVRYHEHLGRRQIPFDSRFYPGPAYAGRRWDVLSMWALFEHVLDSRAVLDAVKANLTPQGLLYVSVPNANALVTRVLGERSNTFGGHSHVQFFSAHTLARLLEACGFEVLDVDTMITELGTINNYLGFDHPYAGQQEPLYSWLTPEFIYANDLGSILAVVARVRS